MSRNRAGMDDSRFAVLPYRAWDTRDRGHKEAPGHGDKIPTFHIAFRSNMRQIREQNE
jgi:predicted oxidoreductase